MANFCAKCGAALTAGARFCPECGAPAAEPTGQQAAGGGPAGSGAQGLGGLDMGGLSANVASLLCYPLLFVSGIVFLMLEPYRRDQAIRFHAWQAIFFAVVWIASRIAFAILSLIFSFMHLSALIALLSGLVWLALFIVWVVLMVKAYSGEQWKLPIIGDLAAEQAAKG